MKKMLKKIISIISITLFIFIIFSNFTIAQIENNNQIYITYNFNKPDIIKIKLNNEYYDKILMPELNCIGNEGEPNLPVYDVKILLPIQSEIEDINIKPSKKTLIGANYKIEPVIQHKKISEIDDNIIINKNLSIYNSNQIFPTSLISNIKTNYFRGYEILFFTLHPMQYIPTTGELYYFEEINLTIETIQKEKQNKLFRNSIKDKIAIKNKFENLSILENLQFTDRFKEKTLENNDEYDLLILTTNEFLNEFNELKEYHDHEGIKTNIKIIENITILDTKINPEDIRDFIKNEYLNYGIEYVLIGGDEDIIPAKELYVESINGGEAVFMPSDLYYSCLDGPYNYDGDNRWGEPNDGENGKDVDLVAEVYVGRACVGNKEEISNFVNKTLDFCDSNKTRKNSTLMVGELLWENPETWASDYMNELINGSENNNYKTIGIPSEKYYIETLYDYNWPNNDWGKDIIINKINNETEIINHLGHSSSSYNMKMSINDIDLLKNEKPFFIYSQGCYSGGFDIGDSISEYYTVKTEHAAHSAIMNARSGWGMAGSTDGASQRYHREFWDAIFGENINEIGKANQDSKEDLLARINYPCMRWCYYQLNLFGDPTIKFHDINNEIPEIPIEPYGKRIGKTDKEYNFYSESIDEDNDFLFYRWDWGDGTFSNWIGPFESDEISNVTHIWNKAGKYNIRVKTCDEHKAESDWSNEYPVYIIKNLDITKILNKINEIVTLFKLNINYNIRGKLS